jgi:hypothetical protein
MIISRVKAGCFMVSGSIALFGLAAILTDDSLPETKAAALTPFQNLLVMLIIVGVYFVLSSKTCPVCGEKVIRSAVEFAEQLLKLRGRGDPSRPIIVGSSPTASDLHILNVLHRFYGQNRCCLQPKLAVRAANS